MEIPKELAGQCIAMLDDETIIAAGLNSIDAYRKAKVLYPKKKITLMYVPSKRERLAWPSAF
tara:strand:+ start:16723 stop:16908 length:186 start_codon:yes stop_codon:yes gene_type:complete